MFRNQRGYDTVVIATPVKVEENSKLEGDYLTAVTAIKKESIEKQRFYLHEALTIKKKRCCLEPGILKKVMLPPYQRKHRSRPGPPIMVISQATHLLYQRNCCSRLRSPVMEKYAATIPLLYLAYYKRH